METTDVYTSIQCPNVLALQQFVQTKCGSVNRALVRDIVEQAPRFPLISLNDLTKILQSWDFQTYACKATLEGLTRLEGPLLAHCIWPDEDRYFVVIRHVSADEVHYFSPFRGEVSEPLSAFAKHWSGALLLAQPAEPVASDLLRSTDDESIAVAAYSCEHVRLQPEFFSEEECRFIIKYAEDNALFTRSRVEYDKNEPKESDVRTSYSAFFKDRQEPIFQTIYQRVAKWLQVDERQIENLQCVRYGEGQQFKPHFDSGLTNHRLHTLLVYLNDDFVGGETYFPELNVRIQPKRGTALYFLNRSPDNTVLLCSAHAGLPVAYGQKYACNIWVRNQPIE